MRDDLEAESAAASPIAEPPTDAATASPTSSAEPRAWPRIRKRDAPGASRRLEPGPMDLPQEWRWFADRCKRTSLMALAKRRAAEARRRNALAQALATARARVERASAQRAESPTTAADGAADEPEEVVNHGDRMAHFSEEPAEATEAGDRRNEHAGD